MELGYGLLILLISAVLMLGGIMVLGFIEKPFFGTDEDEEEEDDGYIYYWEI